MQSMMKNLMGDMENMNWMEVMNPTKTGLQILNCQKSVFNNTYNSMVLIQQQTEKMADYLLENVPGISEEWSSMLKKNQDYVKQNVGEGFCKAESYFTAVSSLAKEAEPEAAETVKEKAAPLAK